MARIPEMRTVPFKVLSLISSFPKGEQMVQHVTPGVTGEGTRENYNVQLWFGKITHRFNIN